MNDQIYKNWRKDVGTDYETTRKLVDEDYTRANTSRNTENELVEMNKKLTGATAMTRDDIIRMAREAGLSNEIGAFGYPYLPELERFHAIAVAAEREACAKVVENHCGAWDDEGYALAQAIRARGEK
jgi:hypothetical protein